MQKTYRTLPFRTVEISSTDGSGCEGEAIYPLSVTQLAAHTLSALTVESKMTCLFSPQLKRTCLFCCAV